MYYTMYTYIVDLWGPFTNYVDKKRWVGSPKMSNFVNFYKVENVNVGGGGRWSK